MLTSEAKLRGKNKLKLELNVLKNNEGFFVDLPYLHCAIQE